MRDIKKKSGLNIVDASYFGPLFGWRFAGGPIVARFHVLPGYLDMWIRK